MILTDCLNLTIQAETIMNDLTACDKHEVTCTKHTLLPELQISFATSIGFSCLVGCCQHSRP